MPYSDLSEDEKAYRLLEAVNEAYKEMLVQKARLGEVVITADTDGVVREQMAIDVYRRVYGELPPLRTTL